MRANQFILEEETGNLRAGLIVDKNGPALSLYDEKDQVRAILVVRKNGPG